MTEAEWLACTDSQRMLEIADLHGLVKERKIRLFAVACCRRIWDKLPDLASQNTVLDAEELADGQLKIEKMARRRIALGEIAQASALSNARRAAWEASWLDIEESRGAVCLVARNAAAAYLPHDIMAAKAEPTAQAVLLRDIFGNPFSPSSAIDHTWLKWKAGIVVTLAQQMYDARDFASMPILADALEEAGCTDGGILEHCRGPGPHVRGCWVVDLVLGKE